METTIIYGSLIALGVILLLVVVLMILVISNHASMKKNIKTLSDTVSALQRQVEVVAKQNTGNDELVATLKSAVSSAVANQMEYEVKQMKQQLEAQEKKAEKDIQSTMVMPKLPNEKVGTILCRNCYKPYPASEKKCPFCQARHSK